MWVRKRVRMVEGEVSSRVVGKGYEKVESR